MAGNKFSIGLDCQLVVIGPSGQVNLTHVTGFDSRQNTHSVRVSRMDGINLGAELPKGWEGSFEIERGSSAVDDMIAAIELGYYAGGSLGTGTLYQFISETDGSVSSYQYNNVTFKLVNAGAWKGDASVKQRLEFFASQRVRV